MKIDSTKNPSGATHWAEDPRCYSTGGIQYYRHAGGEWSYWAEAIGTGWIQCLEPCKPVFPVEEQKVEEWTAEGLPLVGTKFEACNRGDGNWRKAEMLFAGKEIGVMMLDTGAEYSFYMDEWEYRPIRTPEQIAAEEKRLAIAEIIDDCNLVDLLRDDPKEIAERIYIAGYRKQVAE